MCWPALKANRTKIWVGAVTLLLVFYLVVSFQRSVLLMSDANPVAKAIGVAYLAASRHRGLGPGPRTAVRRPHRADGENP